PHLAKAGRNIFNAGMQEQKAAKARRNKTAQRSADQEPAPANRSRPIEFELVRCRYLSRVLGCAAKRPAAIKIRERRLRPQQRALAAFVFAQPLIERVLLAFRQGLAIEPDCPAKDLVLIHAGWFHGSARLGCERRQSAHRHHLRAPSESI